MTWENDAKKLIEMLKPLDDTGPVHPTFTSELGVVCAGITKRELFAGFAMLGLLANSRDGDIVKASVRFSDALLGELKRTAEPVRTQNCTHKHWEDLKAGLARCVECGEIGPYGAFGCAPDEA